jgi:hypothetical protein
MSAMTLIWRIEPDPKIELADEWPSAFCEETSQSLAMEQFPQLAQSRPTLPLPWSKSASSFEPADFVRTNRFD